MKVWTCAVFDIESSRFLAGECYEYDGPVAELKGAGTADSQRQAELGMQQKAFNAQMTQLNQLQTAMTPYLSGQIGYSPQQYASMQSQFLNQNAAQFQNAGQAVRQALLARGGGLGDMPVSGDYTRGISSLMGAAASSQAQGILGLQQANAQQALQNQLNAAGILSGGAQILGQTQGVAGSGASSALSSYIQAKNQGLMQQFMSGLGGGLGSLATGGLSGIAGGITSALGGGGFGGGFYSGSGWGPIGGGSTGGGFSGLGTMISGPNYGQING